MIFFMTAKRKEQEIEKLRASQVMRLAALESGNVDMLTKSVIMATQAIKKLGFKSIEEALIEYNTF
jgi:porphobilinogen deaminase